MNTGKALKSAAVIPIFTNTALTLIQLAIGIMMKSVGIISFGLDTIIDLFISVICLVGITHAARPATAAHPYGYGKAENIATLFVSVAIFGTAALLVYESAVNLMNQHRIGHVWLGVAVMVVSAAVNFAASRHLLRESGRLDSSTLRAQGINLKIDAITSVAIIAGLVAIRFTGLTFIDPLIAILIVAALIKTGIDIMKPSLLDLMDRRLPEDEEEGIMEIIRGHSERFV
ncbi:MAG TPA: cation diffusion facilitator family transporter, partial [bacterium]|nr:cation diffusion facilitator family transporter [bacterium]